MMLYMVEDGYNLVICILQVHAACIYYSTYSVSCHLIIADTYHFIVTVFNIICSITLFFPTPII